MRAFGSLVVAVVAHGYFAYSQLHAAPIPPDVKQIVTFVFLADQNGELLRDKEGNPVPRGTGFFVGVPRENGKPEAGVYLVTAKQVLRADNGDFFPIIFLRLNGKDGDAEFVRVNVDQRFIYLHADATIDVAVLPLLPPDNIFDYKVLSTNDFASSEKLKELKVSEGSDVFFTGLLTNHYGGSKNTPVVRFGRVAMFPDQPVPWKEKVADA